MTETTSVAEQARQQLLEAKAKGPAATLAVFVRMSGPGWLQSAITLGGGSLAGALFLGILGGTSLLWLQLVAIIMGVIMLSAISYVTLSTGQRPFRAINQHINPALGWGWIVATMMANMIWCMPQFSLCYAALQKNLIGPDTLGDGTGTKLSVSLFLLAFATYAVVLNSRQGLAAKAFDWFLKILVGIVVICFVGVVVLLANNGSLDWAAVFGGFVPDLSQWNEPAGNIAPLVNGLSQDLSEFWTGKLVTEQRAVMIGAAATAVGINMTFLMPYSLLKRGWDKPFRGLARFDLATGMAIPYVMVTSCVVIAAASKFHAQADDAFLSSDPSVMASSDLYGGAEPILTARLEHELGVDAVANMSADEKSAQIAALPAAEKKIVSSLVKRNAFDLSKSLAPLLGEQKANLAFGIGVFGMGFSSIIILMLINGFAVCEMADKPLGGGFHVLGCLIAGVVGALWPFVWESDAQVYLAIVASSFGMMLLPIAYLTFFLMMNSQKLMGEEKPTGGKMVLWNVLMGISVVGAIVAATSAVIEKAGNTTPVLGTAEEPVLTLGTLVVTIAIVYIALVVVGFAVKRLAK